MMTTKKVRPMPIRDQYEEKGMKGARERGECSVYSSVARKEADATVHVTPPVTR